jgi:hypothetical protein
MAKMPKVEKVPVDMGRKVQAKGGGRLMRTVRQFRKDSNQTIAQEAVNRRGFVRLSVFVKMREEKTGTYVGFSGSSISMDATSYETAELFVQRVKESCIKTAQELGMKLPNTVIMEKETA